MDIALGQVEHNLATARAMVAEAAQSGSDVVVLPELWSTAYDLENAADHAAPVEAGIFAQTAVLAAEFRIHIVGSCLSLIASGRYGNTAVLFGPDGTRLGDYTKLHLFRLMDEERYLTPGDRTALVDTPWGMAGLAICYDLRFPELFRDYALAGATIIFLPSEWPQPRLAHWRTLLRARAIENQLFFIACNRVGVTDGYDFFGHSAIIDPWGETVIEGGEDQELITAEVDLAEADRIRARIPVFDDRRPDIY
ncbi:MAG: carbon-nitrogen family hydrolase [Chloroflexota bacterium]|nr:MAG: carbon-nitrogen family hydrolase [Chloroflexota bacterium]